MFLTRIRRQTKWLFHCGELNVGWIVFFFIFLLSYSFPFSILYLWSSSSMDDGRCASYTSGTINFDFLMHSRLNYSINCFFFSFSLENKWNLITICHTETQFRGNFAICFFLFNLNIKNRPNDKRNNTLCPKLFYWTSFFHQFVIVHGFY